MLIVLYLFSTSNHNSAPSGELPAPIVLYLFSTSNHNYTKPLRFTILIVLYLFSTSNHNCNQFVRLMVGLSYTFFLHQTTTTLLIRYFTLNCLIPFFYIKPQLSSCPFRKPVIVLYLFSTSNHNCVLCGLPWRWIVLYLFSTSNHNQWQRLCGRSILSYTFFLHQTTTQRGLSSSSHYCLIPFFYIKPQLCVYRKGMATIVLYLFSTSNHNSGELPAPDLRLSYTFFLHQTTTEVVKGESIRNCLIPFFYIKPQHGMIPQYKYFIVLYLFSTSNHNWKSLNDSFDTIVLYLFSTSNHNSPPVSPYPVSIVLYLFSTSNHNTLVFRP